MQIDYRIAESEDFRSINGLIDLAFGEGYHKTKNLKEEGYYIHLALLNDQVIGIATGLLSTAQQHSEFTKVKGYLPIGILALLDMLIVHPDFRKMGIGCQLFKIRQQFFEQKDNHFALLHWKEGVFEQPLIAIRNGFRKVIEVPNFWKEESQKEGFNCERCGEPPCNCTAVLYQK